MASASDFVGQTSWPHNLVDEICDLATTSNSVRAIARPTKSNRESSRKFNVLRCGAGLCQSMKLGNSASLATFCSPLGQGQ